MKMQLPAITLLGSLGATQALAHTTPTQCLNVPSYTTPSVINPYTATQLPTLKACCDVPKDILSLDQSAAAAAQATAKPGEICFRRNPAGWYALAEQVCNGFTKGGFNELKTSYPYACAAETETGRPFMPMPTESSQACKNSPFRLPKFQDKGQKILEANHTSSNRSSSYFNKSLKFFRR